MQDGTQSQPPEMFFFKSGKCNSSPNQKIRKAVRKMIRLIRENGSDQRTKNKSKNMEETERRLKLDTYKNYLKEYGNKEAVKNDRLI